MRRPRLRLRTFLVWIGIVAVAIRLCMSIHEWKAISLAKEAVQHAWPGTDFAEYNISVGGPDRWQPRVKFQHKDGRSGLSAIVHPEVPYVVVYCAGPPPSAKRR
jgi:hypothetical protein